MVVNNIHYVIVYLIITNVVTGGHKMCVATSPASLAWLNQHFMSKFMHIVKHTTILVFH